MSTITATTKFLVSSAALLRVTQHAQLTMPRNQPIIPILENLLLSIASTEAGSQLQVTGYDLEHHFTSRALPIERTDTGAVHLCVSGPRLVALLKNLPDQPLTLRASGDAEMGSRLHMTAVTGAGGLIPGDTAVARYKLSGDYAADYPVAPALGAVLLDLQLPGHILLSGLAATLPITSRDELRPAMTGVLVTVANGSIEFAATDGHRLVSLTKEIDVELSTPLSFIIPRRSAELLAKLVTRNEEVDLLVSATQLLVRMEKGHLQSRLIDERYPDYRKVIPLDSPNVLTVHRTELLASVKRCQLFSSAFLHQVKLVLATTGCQLQAENRDDDVRATEAVPGVYEGADMSIGFNARFLRAFLEMLPCQSLRMAMSRSSAAAILTSADANDGLLCLLMPVNINDYSAQHND